MFNSWSICGSPFRVLACSLGDRRVCPFGSESGLSLGDFLVAAHGLETPSSNHTLLCSYQMREMGIMVGDVHTCHVKGPMGALGTQSLVFKDGTTVDLNCKSALMTFNTTIPTMKEVDNLPKYQIDFK